MSDRLQETQNRAVQQTLTASYCPDVIREARERQDAILQERFLGGTYTIADIGCGTGYHGAIFAPSCVVYHGFEIAPELAALSRETWREAGLDHAEVFLGDVAEADLEDASYDLVFCLYFTPGNFRDDAEDLSLYSDAYLDRNPMFIKIISRFYKAMKEGGSMFLTVYKDVPEAEAAQVDFYEHTGQHVITPKGSRFVATAERFWSVRWTKKSMLSNLNACGINEHDVVFTDLNAIAWLVEIKKNKV